MINMEHKGVKLLKMKCDRCLKEIEYDDSYSTYEIYSKCRNKFLKKHNLNICILCNYILNNYLENNGYIKKYKEHLWTFLNYLNLRLNKFL